MYGKKNMPKADVTRYLSGDRYWQEARFRDRTATGSKHDRHGPAQRDVPLQPERR